MTPCGNSWMSCKREGPDSSGLMEENLLCENTLFTCVHVCVCAVCFLVLPNSAGLQTLESASVSHSVVSDSLGTMDYRPARLLCPRHSPGPYIHNGILLGHKNKILPFATTWTDLALGFCREVFDHSFEFHASDWSVNILSFSWFSLERCPFLRIYFFRSRER